MNKAMTAVIIGISVVAFALAIAVCAMPQKGPALLEGARDGSLPPASYIHEEPIRPISGMNTLDIRKVDLGGLLFRDTRLSHDNTISCASCHILSRGGADQVAHSLGIGGAIGEINAPTVLNSGLNFRQFWNGRAGTLDDQVNGPTHNPKEMGSNWAEIIGKLKQSSSYSKAFSEIYPAGLTPGNVRDSIATFERSLTTPNCRFDRYLRGDQTALSNVEKKGYRLFKQFGCISCHQGANIGGNMFQVFGVMGDYFHDRGHLNNCDFGRYNVTGRERDKFVFRVPSLRNIALTAPYFHDGSATTLPQAVNVMAQYQLGRYLETDQLVALVEFLQSLTGDQPLVEKQAHPTGEQP